jgi:hypothetical protein
LNWEEEVEIMKKLLRNYRDEDIDELDHDFFDLMDKLKKEIGIPEDVFEKLGQEAIDEEAGEHIPEPKQNRKKRLTAKKALNKSNIQRQYWLWVTRPEYYLDDGISERTGLDPSSGEDLWYSWTCHKDTKRGDLALLWRSKRNLTESVKKKKDRPGK